MTPTCAWCLAATPAYNAAGNRKVLTHLTQPRTHHQEIIVRRKSGDISYLEVKDDGPNEAKSKFWVSIYYIFSSNIDQFNFFIS